MESTRIVPDDVEAIAGGFWTPRGGIHCPQWQRETQRLDHDQFLPTYCSQFIPTGGCAVDGGALNGDHSIVYARKLGPDGLLFAIEPGPLAFKCLQHNVTLFPHDNTIAVPFALGEHDDTFALHAEHESGDLGMARCFMSPNGSVRVKTLDSIVKAGFPDNQDRKVDFIKLDLEGWELLALRGATRILQDDRPIMVIEINKAALATHETHYDDIIFFLQSLGYRSRQVDGQRHDPLLWDEVCWPAEMGTNPRLAQ